MNVCLRSHLRCVKAQEICQAISTAFLWCCHCRAVTLAAGMACEGLKPVVAIHSCSAVTISLFMMLLYKSNFRNRPCRFSGWRWPNSAYDYAYMRTVPNMVIMAPKMNVVKCSILLISTMAQPLSTWCWCWCPNSKRNDGLGKAEIVAEINANNDEQI